MQADSSVLPSSVSSVPRNKPSNIGLSANFLRKARFFAFDSSVLLISHIAHDILFGTPHLAPVRILFAGLPSCTRHSLQVSRPATRRPLLKKGSIRKLFLRTGNLLFLEKERTWNAGTMDFREPIYGYRAPSPLWVFCALVHGGRHLPKTLGLSAMPPTCTT